MAIVVMSFDPTDFGGVIYGVILAWGYIWYRLPTWPSPRPRTSSRLWKTPSLLP